MVGLGNTITTTLACPAPAARRPQVEERRRGKAHRFERGRRQLGGAALHQFPQVDRDDGPGVVLLLDAARLLGREAGAVVAA